MPKRIFHIECKLKLRYLTILWKSEWMGGGEVFKLGNPEGRRGGDSSSFGNRGGGEGQKMCLPSWGGGDFFWNNPFNVFLFHLRYKRNGKQLNVSYWVVEALGTLNFIGLPYIISSQEAIT